MCYIFIQRYSLWRGYNYFKICVNFGVDTNIWEKWTLPPQNVWGPHFYGSVLLVWLLHFSSKCVSAQDKSRIFARLFQSVERCNH